MQTLQIIVIFITSTAYGAMIYFTITAFVRLRRLNNQVYTLSRHAYMTLSITMSEHIRKEVDVLNDMKKQFNELLEEERFEDAGRLKNIIDHQEQSVKQSIARFKEVFGADVVKVKINNLE